MKSLFDDPDRIKVQWRLIWLNIAAAVFNIVVGLIVIRWISLANAFSAGFSAWVAWGLYTKIPQIKAEQEKRIVDILKGSFDAGY